MANDTTRHSLWCALALLLTSGCSLAHGRDGDGAGEGTVVLCGDATCDLSSRACVRCDGRWTCVEEPDPGPGGLPDWWTNGQLCDPPAGHLVGVPELRCDDDGDCASDQMCVAEADYTFCTSEEHTELWDECVGDRGHLCDDLGDCPPCASRCEPLADSYVRRCR